MKKISFVITVFMTPVMVISLCYILMDLMNMRPEGGFHAITLRDFIAAIIIMFILFMNLDEQIQEAIDRFTENEELI